MDIGKRMSYYLLKNVWKCTVFCKLAIKVSKKCYMTQKKNSKKSIWVLKNAEFYAEFKSVETESKNAPKKIY